jgi:hypothetical protein
VNDGEKVVLLFEVVEWPDAYKNGEPFMRSGTIQVIRMSAGEYRLAVSSESQYEPDEFNFADIPLSPELTRKLVQALSGAPSS